MAPREQQKTLDAGHWPLKDRAVDAALAARDAILAHPRRSVGIGGATVILLLASAFLWHFIIARHAAARATSGAALEALDQHRLDLAKQMALRLIESKDGTYDELGTAAYVLGMAMALETDEKWDKVQADSYLIAARHLQEAHDREFPRGREPEGLFQLGRCLYLSGRYTACRPYLLEALKSDEQHALSIHKYLALAYLKDANPNLEAALKHNTELLQDSALADEERARAMLTRCQIAIRLGQVEACREALDEISKAPAFFEEAAAMRGQLLIHTARRFKRDPVLITSGEAESQAKQKYLEAIELLRQAQSRDVLSREAARKSAYLIGIAYFESGDLRAAENQLARTRQLYHDTPEGLAASLAQADVLRQMDEHEQAVSAYRRTFAAAGSPDDFSNPWISLDEFRSRMLDAYRFYLDGAKFSLALEVLQNFSPMFRRIETIELTAQTHRAWADALIADATASQTTPSREIRRLANAHLLKAGRTYARLAKLRVATRAYTGDIWNSAESYRNGHDYTAAVKMYQEYLEQESNLRRPQALLGLGKAYLAMAEFDDSVRAFQECIEFFPRDAAAFEARLWCSKAYLEMGEIARAEALLLENLTGGTLTPASLEWRDSLFALGHLLHIDGRHQEAIHHLEEAVARYPDTPQTSEGLYTIAESYREAAKVPQEKLQSANIESLRLAHRKQVRQLLEQAQHYYVLVQESLNRREESADLTPMENAMLRNCYFSIGSVLYDLNQYEEAIKAYSDASTRYQNEPIVLEAFVQIADCHRRLNHLIEARGALEQAKVVMKRLPEQASFTTTTNYTRREWERLLAQLSTW